ncbi:hypothetical protein [Methylobacterium haplocladii]|uniref:Uncharacterized protein n=1 Tax=Methylobacterium haplocladii TaxID=1176176 RepID=A0A512IPN1_9HYPH|nr:hypothetical protein [Methylobacterium haplocladii]GEO99657.1 hypothetical protein MHA02_20450 [Methylobacterium haplocladii]GJD83351.1 hypothetical protein HPGCJGGD_1217 [Methylobacterium haplocladii]GLS58226.1 hypothetical protein GCM10007887_08830 [Methylobacterium haplocladii]
MSTSALLVATAPLAAALAALIAAFLTGFDQSTPVPAEVGTRFYGFFLDHYPLYAFAIVYALVRVIAAAVAPGPSAVLRRVLGAAVGLAAILGLSLHPTFGGLVLRGGFMTGGMAFLNQVPMMAAYAFGAAVAASALGFAMGLGVLIAGQPAREPASRLRRFGRSLGTLFSRFLALWYALAVLGFARTIGLGPWPRRPLDSSDVALVAACLVVAFLPHVLISALRADRSASAAG